MCGQDGEAAGLDPAVLHVVELPTENPFDEPTEWTVKVSGRSAFPRWDGPTDEAFERANWQFRGPLEDALRDVVTEWEIRQPKSKNVFIRVSVKVYTDDFKGRTRRD
jgi:hypothetical protein